MNYLRTYWQKALFLLHHKGIFATARKTVYVLSRDYQEWRFDHERNVETRRLAAHPDATDNLQPVTAMPYDPTTPMLFGKIMQATSGMAMPDTFFDMGCGKGRVLIMAAEHGYQHVLGVELDPFLAQAAEINIRKFQKKKNNDANIEVICKDAAAYEFPDKNAVVFFYNPFSESVMAETLQNIRNSARINRIRFIIYHTAFFENLVEKPAEYALLAKNKNYSIYQMIT